MRFEAFVLICFSFGLLLTSFMAAYRRNDRVARVFFLFSVSVVGWAMPMAVWLQETVSLEKTYFLMRISTAFACAVPLTWFHFINAFVRKDFKENRFYIGGYMLVLVLVGLSLFWPQFVLRPDQIGFYLSAVYPGRFYWVKTLLYIVLVPWGFAILFKAHGAAESEKKHQIQYLILATILGFAGGGATIVAVYVRDFSLAILPVMLAYPFFIGIALIKYGFFMERDFAKAAHKDKLATIGTLATSINHEIKNPLYVIRGLTESFAQNEKDSVYSDKDEALNDARDRLAKTKEHTERAVEIMRNFSGFAKQGVSDLPNFKDIEISEVLKKIIPLISYELKLDQISIRNGIVDVAMHVRADERYLEEILFNLIMNSCQAMKLTGGELTLSAKKENDKVLIEIKDNGPGITKEAQKQIFEPFYTTKEEGTGLGLYITKQLVEKIGGKISLESEAGQGTVFRVELKQAKS